MIKKNRINRNDKCPCHSGLKYKNCCIHKESCTIENGQLCPSSDIMLFSLELLHKRFPLFKFIDITDIFTEETYKEFQTKNYHKPIVMVAQKTDQNQEVFIPRINSPKSDIMVMYHGHYRTFAYYDLESVMDSIETILQI